MSGFCIVYRTDLRGYYHRKFNSSHFKINLYYQLRYKKRILREGALFIYCRLYNKINDTIAGGALSGNTHICRKCPLFS